MTFAKILLLLLVLGAIALALLLRVRAWRARRTAAKRAWQAEVDQALRDAS
ncbi:hypothetical protein FM113_08070 [Leucobacter sp. 7(1)]|uniref:hypothetical protein n=1 Tax=Leucobacter sp. 7(1) TaxID=1255613 RepID=UPI00097F4EF9|nr:hypothetical protein [Leucobacter sp. 7(1)]SJN10058.1 hypothetical protein FM113_08070 [Leucobacter sp. 7(1)]